MVQILLEYPQGSAKLPVILSLSLCHPVIRSSCHPVIMSSCHCAIVLLCHHVILSSCHCVIVLSCHHVIMSPCYHKLNQSRIFHFYLSVQSVPGEPCVQHTSGRQILAPPLRASQLHRFCCCTSRPSWCQEYIPLRHYKSPGKTKFYVPLCFISDSFFPDLWDEIKYFIPRDKIITIFIQEQMINAG